MSSYKDLRAWQACHELFLAIHHITEYWPGAEQYELTRQVRRAAWSAASNIVEGTAKRGSSELARYLDMSNGSLAEVGYGIRAAIDLGFLTTDQASRLQSLHVQASKLTFALYRSHRAGVRGRAPRARR